MAPEIRYEKVSVNDLKPFPGNARRGDVEVIKESLETHGQYRPLVVQDSTGYVLAGNHTLRAAQELGWATVDVGIIDVDDDQAKRIVLVDNRSNDLAVYDDHALADLLSEVESLEGTGFDQESLDSLLATLGPGGFAKKDLDKVMDPPDNPITQPGETIQLGVHALSCGDSIELGPADPTVDLVWTDPPYLINYQMDLSPEEAAALHRRRDGKQITNEGLAGEDALAFRQDVMLLIFHSLRPGCPYYIHMPAGPDQADWITAAREAGLEPRQILQWVKDQFTFGRSDYHYRSEPIIYGWRAGGAHRWFGGRNLDSVFEIARPKAAKSHPTMKPVELAQAMIEASSQPGDTVFDPFAGSGTILAAAMQTGRRAIMRELDPAYCDVIVERYERLTGETVRRSK